MSSKPHRSEFTRHWIAVNFIVTLTTIVAYLAFWRLAPVPTFIIGCLALIAMLVGAWIYGGRSLDFRK